MRILSHLLMFTLMLFNVAFFQYWCSLNINFYGDLYIDTEFRKLARNTRFEDRLLNSLLLKRRLLSDRARADTSAPGSSSWLSNMEFSTNSMTDNSFDKDNPLKQVLQLCSTLAGKGCDFSISVRIRDCFSFSLKSGKPQPQQAKKRSPSFYRRQERRKLLRKKSTDPSREESRETP